MNKFQERAEKIFGYVRGYSEYPERGEVIIVIDGDGFSAEQLFALSDLLGTSQIFSRPETRDDGWCETCSFEYSVIVMTASGVNFGD